MTTATTASAAPADSFPQAHFDRRARLGSMVMWALFVSALALQLVVPGLAKAANLEYGPETEQRYVAACMADAPRAECQCRMESLQQSMGMEAFYDAVEAGDDRTLANATGTMGRRCAAAALSVPAEPATQAAEVR